VLPRAWFAELIADAGEQGARRLLARHRQDVVAIANEALALDVDRNEDLSRTDT
jgi:CTP:molybdopterin cytidylyltransferase MocA